MRPFPGAASKWPILPRPLVEFRCQRSAIAAAVAVIFGLPGGAQALGLGAAVGDSVLGETLQLQVPLTGSVNGPLDNNCVSIRRPADPIDPDYFPRDLMVRVDNVAGSLRLLIASRTAIRQPLIQFGVSVTCGYNLARDYLVAVSPRERAPVPMTASAAPAAAKATGTSRAAVAAPAAGQPLPDGMSGKSMVLDREMTLDQLARQHFPGPLRQGRFIRWVVEANPQLFANGDDVRRQRLAAGTQVVIPEGVPPRRPGDYQNGSSPLDKFQKAGAGKVAEIDKVAQTTTKHAAKGSQDRLVVGSGGAPARNYKETVALVQQLTGMLEQQVAAQTANADRIRQLEAGAEELKARITQVETSARQREAQFQAQLQAQAQAAKQAQDELTERAWWQVAIAVLIGGALAAALLQGYRMLAGRRPEAEAAGLEPPSARSAAAVEAVAPAARRTEEPTPTAAEAPAAPRPPKVRTMPAPAMRKPKPELDPLDFEPPPFLQGETKRATTGSAVAIAEVAVQEVPDPAKAAIELANIMTSMGLTESAAQTLVHHIRENPRQSLQHWLKLLELHRLNGKREEYERSSLELRQHFNVQAEDWHGGSAAGRPTLEAYPHIRAQIVKLWRNASCVKFLHSLLMDNREGTRIGFPLSVAEEILLLIAVQSDVQ